MSRRVTDVLSTEQIAKLPSWIKADINNAVFIGDSNSCIEISNGKRYCLANKINDLSGAEWTHNINSVINTHYTTK